MTTAYHFTIEFPTGYVGASHDLTVRLTYLPEKAEKMEAQARSTALKQVAKIAKDAGLPAESVVARLTRTEQLPDDFDPILDLQAKVGTYVAFPAEMTAKFAQAQEVSMSVTETRIQGETMLETARESARIRKERAVEFEERMVGLFAGPLPDGMRWGEPQTETWIQGEVARETALEIARIREEGDREVARIEAEGAAKVARIRAQGVTQGDETRRAMIARHVRIRDKMINGIIVAGLAVFAIWSPLGAVATLAVVVLFLLLMLSVLPWGN